MPTTPMYRVQVVVTGVAGAPYYVVGYFSQAGGTAEAAAGDWITMLVGNRLLVREGSLWEVSPEVQIVSPISGEVEGIEPVTVAPFLGTNEAGLAPRQAQSLISWGTPAYLGGRRVQGRTNVPCLLEGQVDAEGNLETGSRTTLQNRVDLFNASAGSEHVVWSKKYGQWQPSTGLVKTKLATLRSRRD